MKRWAVFVPWGSCRVQYLTTIVLTLLPYYKGFSSLPWPEQSQRAGGKKESVSSPASVRQALGPEPRRVASSPRWSLIKGMELGPRTHWDLAGEEDNRHSFYPDQVKCVPCFYSMSSHPRPKDTCWSRSLTVTPLNTPDIDLQLDTISIYLAFKA